MTNLLPQIPVENIVPLNMNGLRGRMLRLPPKKTKKREILLIYGRRQSLEKVYNFAVALNDYGAVTVPDLPGIGGMDSFYKIGEKPDIETMADYLASIIKLRFSRRRVTLAGISYGFAIITRMLQKYPELAKKTDFAIAWSGFAHNEDFVYSRRTRLLYRFWAKLFTFSATSMLYKNILLHPSLLRRYYLWQSGTKQFDDRTKQLADFEVHLWRSCDLRTHMQVTLSCLKLDNCRNRVEVPVWNIRLKNGNYLDNNLAEQHLRVVFDNLTQVNSSSKMVFPGILAKKTDIMKVIPVKLRRELSKKD